MLSKLHCLLFLLLLAVTSQSQNLQIAGTRPHPLKAEVQSPLHFSRTTDPSAQTDPAGKCGFALVMQRAVSRGFDDAAFEAEIGRLVQRKLAQGRVALDGSVTVPIIFHVVYRTADSTSASASSYLSAAKIQAQVDQLNIDYANGAGSKWAAAANVPIRFCMALVDTAGRPLAEPGIDRINGQLRSWSNTNTQTQNTLINYFDNTIKPGSIWDPYSYVNVWTAAMNRSGLLGYSTFPSLSTLPGLDNAETNATAGVVIAWESVGSVANPGSSTVYGYGRTLTHELGHYFGLRHIWGDATCGNDYCEDTPPQSGETTGCPTTDTLNNCTPLVRKMYENYMDYSYDACLNTFTNDQSLRSQAVMDNSPRRRTLISSKACQGRAANSISFATATPMTISETGSGGCPSTRSYTFRLYVSSAATGAATVNFNAGGTATRGKDFTVSPASVTYTAGDNGVKTVTVTIVDDQVAEPDEKLTLAYSIAGTGVVIGPDKQSITITIVDDDVADNIVVDNVQPLKNVLLQNFDTSAGVIPAGWSTESYAGSLTSANQWTVSANGGSGTTGRSAHITNDTVLKPNVYTNTNPADAYLFTPLLDASGLRDLNLVFKWRCRGEAGFDAGYIGYVPEGQAPTAANVVFFTSTFNGQSASASAATANLNLPPLLSGKKFYFVFNWYNDETAGNSPGFTVDSIVLTGKAYAVASTADADTTFSHFSGQTVTYFSKPATLPVVNRIIAKVSGMTTDAGCLTASIPSAGNGRTLVNNGAFYRTDKVVQLTPAAAVPSASYSVTLYYTAAELAVWGAQIPSLKMMKLKESAALNGPYQAGDVQLVTPVFSGNVAAGYYAYTGTFTGGFSRFMLVTPEAAAPLPVSLLSFTAAAQGRVILLQWSTVQEIANKGFALERSTDGINFTRIGWVNGKGTTIAQTDYSYTDRFVQSNTLYYYRLRQTDNDNKEKLSSIEQARIQDAGVVVTVSPVPAKDYVQVFVTGVRGSASISLINAQGQTVKQWQNANLFSQAFRLDVSGLPAGAYVLKIDMAEQQMVKKITVER